jgi:hypothetical protein
MTIPDCSDTGPSQVALVVDPQRDIDRIMALAGRLRDRDGVAVGHRHALEVDGVSTGDQVGRAGDASSSFVLHG